MRGKKFRFKVQHYIDIATSADSMQVINFSCGGRDLMARCGHLIGAFRYFKLGSISVKFVPASTLPVDPLGLSYAEGDEQTVDPRDQLDCGLVRITNGEDLFTDITALTATQQKNLYDAMLLDPRWYKFGLQSGFARSARPMWYQIGQYHQDIYPGAVTNLPATTTTASTFGSQVNVTSYEYRDNTNAITQGNASTKTSVIVPSSSDPRGFFQTGQRGRFGWLRTDAYQPVATPEGIVDKAMIAPFPEVRVITAVLPKMRKTNYFYRCYITETVYFSGVRSFSMPSISGNDIFVSGGLDTFAYSTAGPITPTTGRSPITGTGTRVPNSGGDEN